MQDQMDLTKEIIENAAYAIGVEKILMWGDLEINLENFSYQKLTDLVLQHNPKISKEQINDKNVLLNYTNELNLKIEESWGYGRLLLEIFESTVEDKLIDPTFVTEYPVEVSPLSRRSNENPDFADRFELFIGGKEFANGFCELNDPDDQL